MFAAFVVQEAAEPVEEVWIPLRQVVSVQCVGRGRRSQVHVKLACDTPFGREFVFEPRFELGALVGEYPVVEELRELAARAKATDLRPGSGTS